MTKLYDKVREEDNFKGVNGGKSDNVNQSKKMFNNTVRIAINTFFVDFVNVNLKRVATSSYMDFLNVLLINWGFIKVYAMTFKFILSKHQNHYMHAR